MSSHLTRGSIILILLVAGVTAQTFRGGLSGSVADQKGAVIDAARVEIVNLGNGLARSQETTSSGDFSFSDLPVGFYSLTVIKQGFQNYKLEKVEVAVGKVTSLSVELGVAQTSETIEIQAAATSRRPVRTSFPATTGLPRSTRR